MVHAARRGIRPPGTPPCSRPRLRTAAPDEQQRKDRLPFVQCPQASRLIHSESSAAGEYTTTNAAHPSRPSCMPEPLVQIDGRVVDTSRRRAAGAPPAGRRSCHPARRRSGKHDGQPLSVQYRARPPVNSGKRLGRAATTTTRPPCPRGPTGRPPDERRPDIPAVHRSTRGADAREGSRTRTEAAPPTEPSR